MIKKIMRELGLAMISYGTLFTPILASADDGSAGMGVAIGFPAGAVITGVILVSMSRTKVKADKADNYVKGDLKLHAQDDVYLRTETSKEKIDKD